MCWGCCRSLSLLEAPCDFFINDTPCGFVRHVEYREPSTAQKLWGSTAGCFERPSLEKDPDGDLNFPCIVPVEYSDGSNMRKVISNADMAHPIVDTSMHFVLGDRFHRATNPHKSHLCKYHNLELCLQANTLKTSIQESQNNRKNQRRLRSSTVQNFETRVTFNYLMDFYQNEEIMEQQWKIMKARLTTGQQILREEFLRFTISSDNAS
ncbi:high mobility group [Porites harrisoni]